jgi:ectoine hydroxylase-related dioxygenase (phytanoyl-CoA dioxygenase family)
MSFKQADVLDEIKERGFAEIKGLFDPALFDRVESVIERPLQRMSINGRRGYTQFGSIRYLNHTLSWGKDIVDLYTHPALIELFDAYAGDPVHLSNFRIYRTLPSKKFKMEWHVDNKTDVFDVEQDRFINKVVPMDRGIILIMYLSDVEDGGFQIVPGSHRWDNIEELENWDSREAQFSDHVVTFNNMKKGTVIVYDYRAIHRAKPYKGGQVRTSLFGQYSPSWMPTGEPVLLSTRDIADLTETQKRVLNFGRAPSTENWPIGTEYDAFRTMKLSRLLRSLVSQYLR